MGDQFLKWLNRPDCLNDLLPCARGVIRRADNLGITLDDAYLDGGDFKTYHSAVASHLWQFLREEVETLTEAATTILMTRDEKGLTRFIIQEFIDSRINERRNDSPFHAYYRHMRTVLSDADGINYKSVPRKASYYAWSHTEGLQFIPDENEFSNEHLNYKEWASSTIAFNEIHKKPSMILLSRHYWDEALRIILNEYLLSIRGLVAFIATQYPLVPSEEYESSIVNEDDSETPSLSSGGSFIGPVDSVSDDAWTRQLPTLARSIIEIDLDMIARDCVAKLTSFEKGVLCGLDASQKGTEIAKHLGMKGPSNVSYHRRLAEEKLRTAWSLWGQPDSEHYAVAEEEQRIFFKKVIGFCKETNTCRDSGKERRP